ncbi:DUF7941 domain-family protein [Paraburkholderia adhaesiva]|uniref:DUF7941 domain-family protein n=1 Tax=Paraburkholderia adhaesiva TaxID=2883244 RepID=UPI001F4337F0|nr:hypothetical protein [Paraburkholderia adhaesiva]
MLPECGIGFGKPVQNRPLRGDALKCNTRVTVTIYGMEEGKRCDEGYGDGRREEPLRGSRTFWYRRIDLRLVAASRVRRPAVPIAGYPSRTHELLDEINRYYGLKLEEEDVENLVYQPGETAWLVASPASLVFTGRTRLDLARPAITSLVDITSLGGFDVAA